MTSEKKKPNAQKPMNQELTDEWSTRNIEDQSQLVETISQTTFDIASEEHKKLKGLDDESLHDHLTDLERVFLDLGELAAAEIARATDAQGFEECEKAAYHGGNIAGEARLRLEQETGEKVISSQNFLALGQKKRPQLSSGE